MRPGTGRLAEAMAMVRFVAGHDGAAPVRADTALLLVEEIDWLWGELFEFDDFDTTELATAGTETRG